MCGDRTCIWLISYVWRVCHNIPYNTILYHTTGVILSKGSGYISYAEYLFLLTALISMSFVCVYVCMHICKRARTSNSLILVPVHQFEIAFKMFDLDGNGIVDLEEFAKVWFGMVWKGLSGTYFAVFFNH